MALAVSALRKVVFQRAPDVAVAVVASADSVSSAFVTSALSVDASTCRLPRVSGVNS